MELRPQYEYIWQQLAVHKSLVLLAGPRQVGKTTLAKMLAEKHFANSLYFNWDILPDRERFIEDPYFFQSVERIDQTKPLVIFDEIHKYKDWKNYLKGVYDQFHQDFQFLVTGSGRLDLYQKGGDSLAGRYLLFYLWPFTLTELTSSKLSFKSFRENPLDITVENTATLHTIWQHLETLSGFPEPYLSKDQHFYQQWSSIYTRQLIREDIRDLSGIKSIGDVETLYTLLPSRIGSALSVTSLARDLKVAYNSIQHWLQLFEQYFLCFSINPWHKKIARAIHKERKIYLWNSPSIIDKGAKFENMVALELWRAISNWNCLGYGSFKLHYIKTKEGKEVDFLICQENEPLLLIETKLTDTIPSSTLKKMQNLLQIPAVQLVNQGNSYRTIKNDSLSILIAPAYLWLAGLP